ncbi:interleukin 12 receptor, beta 2a, like isoform X1 [Scleropages formosus]|uniref:interleukin 12 receptor, beta 2a, like isoform X1 n=1 Tax=Scleropages formosus TaxID=113540 RepID=UPI0010FAA80D|nr:interleukin-6 receptor subunit beta-like isoform X1 [Scleropages formosus]
MAWLNPYLILSLISQQAIHVASVPSPPKCKILPRDGMDIRCSWDPGLHPALYYTLHWVPDSQRNEGQVNSSFTSAIIPRIQFLYHWDMCVWVTAWNPPMIKTSNRTCFNTDSIEQRDPPKVTVAEIKLLEIHWTFDCVSYDNLLCNVQHRIKDESDWTEEPEDLQNGFLLEDALPFSVYQFRVRCACREDEEVPLSDWSSICEVETPEAKPVGVLDVWSQCRHSTEHSDCAVLWKELPRHLARGHITGYGVILEHGGTKKYINVSAGAAEWREDGRDYCCRLLLSLEEARGLHVTAHSLQGATEPSHLVLLAAIDHLQYGKLFVTAGSDGRSLNVSWDAYSVKEPVQEYVVQYKELGRNWTIGFDWIKVANTEKSVIFAGDFRNYTPYNVSLFRLFANRKHLLGSAIAYTVQDIPPEVKGFQISEIFSTKITLIWQHIPLVQRRGIILGYTIGLGDNDTEYAVPKEKNNYSIEDLQIGKTYKIWICAETVKGRGPRTTVSFVHSGQPSNNTIIVLMISLSALLFGASLLLCCCVFNRQVNRFMVPSWCYEKVPDPTNSRLFQPDQDCFSNWTVPSTSEANLNICQLEVIECQIREDKSSLEKTQTSDTCAQVEICELSNQDLQEEKILDEQEKEYEKDKASSCSSLRKQEVELSSGVEDYSTVRDTYGWERGNLSPVETRQFFSDYEKHFMPSPYEV